MSLWDQFSWCRFVNFSSDVDGDSLPCSTPHSSILSVRIEVICPKFWSTLTSHCVMCSSCSAVIWLQNISDPHFRSVSPSQSSIVNSCRASSEGKSWISWISKSVSLREPRRVIVQFPSCSTTPGIWWLDADFRVRLHAAVSDAIVFSAHVDVEAITDSTRDVSKLVQATRIGRLLRCRRDERVVGTSTVLMRRPLLSSFNFQERRDLELNHLFNTKLIKISHKILRLLAARSSLLLYQESQDITPPVGRPRTKKTFIYG